MRETADAVAATFGEEKLSYRELNIRANQVAQELRRIGVGPDVLVAISIERSLDLVVGLLGILRRAGRMCRWIRHIPVSGLR